MREIDARGKPCPQPVLLVKAAIDAGETAFTILVDNRAAVENVRRYGEKSGYNIKVEEQQGCWRLTGTREGAPPTAGTSGAPGPAVAQTGAPASHPPTAPAVEVYCGTGAVRTLLIQTEALGRGDEELGRKLVKILLDTLAVNETRPETILLVNGGVKLACEGSPVLEALQDIAQKGVQILACGTCLNHFNLTHALKVGRPTNAYELLNTLLAGNVLVWG